MLIKTLITSIAQRCFSILLPPCFFYELVCERFCGSLLCLKITLADDDFLLGQLLPVSQIRFDTPDDCGLFGTIQTPRPPAKWIDKDGQNDQNRHP